MYSGKINISLKIIIVLTTLIIISNNLHSQNVKLLPVNDSTVIQMEGDQFSFDGMKIDQSRMEEKFLEKQKKYALTPKEKALKTRENEGDSLSFSERQQLKKIEKKEKKLEKLIDKYGKKSDEYEQKEAADSTKTAKVQEKYALTDEELDLKVKQANGDSLSKDEEKALKKIEKKEKKLEKNGLEYSEGTDDRPQLLTVPTKKKSFKDFFKKYQFSVKKRTKVSKDQKKLTRLAKRCELTEEETDAKNKVASGYPLNSGMSKSYKRALVKDMKFEQKSKKIQHKQFLSIQSKEVQERMKANDKSVKKRDNKRSRQKFFRKVKYTLMFWKD